MPKPRGPAAKKCVAATLIALLLVVAGLVSGAAQGRRTSSRRAIAARTSARHAVVIGHSVLGRPLRVVRIGDPRAPRHVLVAACIHGDEPAGIAITRALRSASIPKGVSVWVLDQANPDGCAATTRANAHQVDLNRNSPWYWRRIQQPGGVYYSGPRAWSEPESRDIDRFILRLHPAVTIWYHQHARLVDDSGGDRRIERRYARLSGLPFVHLGFYRGSFTGWQNRHLRGTTAFVVELPAGSLSRSSVARHVRAVLAVAASGGR